MDASRQWRSKKHSIFNYNQINLEKMNEQQTEKQPLREAAVMPSANTPYTLTKVQMDRIAHSLGISFYHAMMSHRKKDKTLPKEFYRNYYQTENDSALNELVEKGLAVTQKQHDLNYYFITDKGIELFRKEFSELIRYTPKSERGLEYLKNRINLYCNYHGYNFGSNNFQHVWDEFKNKFSKGIYVSHTTKDCCNTFKAELKRQLKAELSAEVTH